MARPAMTAEALALALFGAVTVGQGVALTRLARDEPPQAAPAETAGAARRGGLVAAASGSAAPLLERLAEAWQRARPGEPVELVPGSGSEGVLAALARGAVDVGLLSASLSEPERALGLHETPYVRASVVLAAAPDVADERLSPGEVLDLAAGRRDVWSDGTPAVLLLRDPGSSGSLAIARRYPEVARALRDAFAARRFRTIYSDGGMLDALQRVPGSAGISDLGQVRLRAPRLKVLTELGDKTLRLVTLGSPVGRAAELVAFALAPEQLALAREAGYREVQ